MKKGITITDYIGIIGIATMIIVPCFTNEIRIILMEKWQIIMFGIGIGLLVLKIVNIWIRWQKEYNIENVNKLKSELDNITKKIKALKKYRDIESIKIINEFNSNFKKLSNNPNWNPTITDTFEIMNLRNHTEKIDEYNEAFKDWGLGDYGIVEHLTTIDKPKI